MLFRKDALVRIAAGEITQAFRSWRRPNVQAGTRLHTAVGVLEILAVDPIDPTRITTADARRAGAIDVAAVRQALADAAWRGGTPYRIIFRLAGEDPRIALRRQRPRSTADIQDLLDRLQRLDSRSVDGPWTATLLRAIRTSPDVHARTLADALGWRTDRLKRRVRTLKNLGLTESLPAGYRLSPRGDGLLASM